MPHRRSGPPRCRPGGATPARPAHRLRCWHAPHDKTPLRQLAQIALRGAVPPVTMRVSPAPLASATAWLTAAQEQCVPSPGRGSHGHGPRAVDDAGGSLFSKVAATINSPSIVGHRRGMDVAQCSENTARRWSGCTIAPWTAAAWRRIRYRPPRGGGGFARGLSASRCYSAAHWIPPSSHQGPIPYTPPGLGTPRDGARSTRHPIQLGDPQRATRQAGRPRAGAATARAGIACQVAVIQPGQAASPSPRRGRFPTAPSRRPAGRQHRAIACFAIGYFAQWRRHGLRKRRTAPPSSRGPRRGVQHRPQIHLPRPYAARRELRIQRYCIPLGHCARRW